jgi:hypothetical protein
MRPHDRDLLVLACWAFATALFVWLGSYLACGQ